MASNTADYLFKQIIEIHKSETKFKEKLGSLRAILKLMLDDLAKLETQYFSGEYTKLIYLCDRYNLPQLKAPLSKLRYFSGRGLKKEYDDIEKIYFYSLYTLANSIKNFYNVPFPKELQQFIRDYNEVNLPFVQKKEIPKSIAFIRAIIRLNCEIQDVEANEIICENEELGLFILMLDDRWAEVKELAWEGAVLHIFSAKYVEENPLKIRTTRESILVLEPDYLIDATELAECFQNSSTNHLLHLLKKFSAGKVSLLMVAGNIINYFFDEVISGESHDFKDIFENALKAKPLQNFTLKHHDEDAIVKLRDIVKSQYELLKRSSGAFRGDYFSVEPSFVSAKYGLQGRLDVLIEHENDRKRKDIIELKSGSPPKTDQGIYHDKIFFKTGVWNNHLAQITCYNLLLDSTFEGRTGSSLVLYSKTEDEPIRNVPNITPKKQELMQVRNRIIAMERALALDEGNLPEMIHPEKIGLYPKYEYETIYNFANSYSLLNNTSRAYFLVYLGFIQREIFASKIGAFASRNNNGFASLWLDTISSKTDGYEVLTKLKLLSDESDFVNYHLSFSRDISDIEEYQLSAFRKGDMALLYPVSDDNDLMPLNHQLIKCTIKSIEGDCVRISLRNKQFNKTYFDEFHEWVLEPDYIDSTNKTLFRSLSAFLLADNYKKDLLLGLIEPRFGDDIVCIDPTLNDNQNQLLCRALSAQDYFILQGPPGTGKTSFMLKSMVEYIYNNTDENILLLAYTNRAVDEICSAIKRIKISAEGAEYFSEFIRTGSKESTEHTDVSIAHLAENISLKDLYAKVVTSRIVVSTVTSMMTNPEIFELKNFDTVIIDEASQILEPQIIGILCKVKRFIMIGDEKQLPAIVLQGEKYVATQSEELKAIGLNHLAGSLFERLLKTCTDKGWNNAYGMLSQQARMHSDIQDLANKLFYFGELKTLADWQTELQSVFNSESENLYEKLLAKNRVIFINSGAEEKYKVHTGEAQLVASFVETIRNKYGEIFNEKTVGVIAPFRAQCAEIYNALPHDIRKVVTVDTIERFQGSEREIIIISFAVNHEYQLESIQSIVEINGSMIDRKLNVAITRAKQHLIMLGNVSILRQSPIFNEMLEYLDQNQ